ncbi:hypothetical protein TBLA_0A09260 [Henningerozyma blattae CBS 6284]|uniref:t-SNARE coiled-coil homology domain-containing protein n=1 Tax=Henningerozyma blattae (strain ATCC 34711 / CBS 6284 / DSM 70876 / NBRC 10599 / NRRL Y-10934 / UCD 77-7) TaxID=1071380 RepID=I2GX61_HENB6|nr:hypothetical protein TBLA_0A09260 [Tetrapisispora blattae CBS 6284]CCH58713.1 hypothetical protein TBLA_0A09260 [Tetrapisispora blattae CBS 6284]
MSDITNVFRKYVSIIEENRRTPTLTPDDIKSASQTQTLIHESLNDSFMFECKELFKTIIDLRKILISIEPRYLDDSDLTEEEKDDMDTEIRLQFQQYMQKFRMLEKYETERQSLIDKQVEASKNKLSNILLSSSKGNKKKLNNDTHNEFRLGVLQSLNLWIGLVSSQFSSMQEERLAFQKKFEATDFSVNSSSPVDLHPEVSISLSKPLNEDDPHEEIKHFEETISRLTQEQVQLLETEHEELINHKNDQLKKVENINKTITDIVSIQHELATHLQTQSQNINKILDNQDDVEINIREGNKQLAKARKSASRTAKMTTYIAIILGILILFLDYIG